VACSRGNLTLGDLTVGLQYPNGSEGHNCCVEFLVDLRYQFLSDNLLMPIAV
jgi:hypothetical protein